MEEPARHLLFHGVIILLLGLLAGIPYGRAILKKEQEQMMNSLSEEQRARIRKIINKKKNKIEN